MEVHQQPDQPPRDFVLNMEEEKNKINENKKQARIKALQRRNRTGLYYCLIFFIVLFYLIFFCNIKNI